MVINDINEHRHDGVFGYHFPRNTEERMWRLNAGYEMGHMEIMGYL